MRDQAVRCELGIPLTRAAKLAGVSHITLRLYEADPQSVKNDSKRASCAAMYDRFRALLTEAAA
jgi:hypothetical protein